MTDATRIPYLIIGGSSAALGCIRGIRSADPERPITVAAKEADGIYSHPLIAHWLCGELADDRLPFVEPESYERNGVTVLAGTEVVRIDAAGRSAVLADGSSLAFEKALIACGGRPIVPRNLDVAGVEGASTFTAWDDARRVRARIESGAVRRAVVVGGGFIGVISASALAQMGISVTIVELADRILSASLNEPGSAIARDALERGGVAVRGGVAADAVQQDGGVITGVTLTGGESLECDLLILAIGVLPDTRVVEGSGINVGRGILVGEHLETSQAGIYAAGDVAEASDRLTGASRPIPIFPNAHRQGYVAGLNMAGVVQPFPGGVARNSLIIFGLPLMSIGVPDPPDDGCEVLVSRDDERRIYRKLILRGGRVIGSILIGDISHAGVMTHLINEGVEISSCKHQLLTDQFRLDRLPPAYWQRGEDVKWTDAAG